MPVPKKHHTHQRTNARRSHFALKPAQFAVCSHCGAATMPHQICGHCGYYKGREVVNTLAKVEKKAKKRRAKHEEAKKTEEEKEKPATLEELSKK